MNIKAVVKVMNFHALLRVESSRRQAEVLATMEEELENMMRIVLNNRNLRLDKKIGAPDPTKPKLRIFFGSDFGFCGSINSSITALLQSDTGSQKVIVGKKLRKTSDTDVYMTFEEYGQNFEAVRDYLVSAVVEKKWSKIELVYNHFYNISSIKPETKCIYPLDAGTKNKQDELDDFIIEDEKGTLFEEMLVSYLTYEVQIAAASSYASENTMRQNSTTESLKKLDEMEAEELRIKRKENTAKSFKKTIDSYVKQVSLKA